MLAFSYKHFGKAIAHGAHRLYAVCVKAPARSFCTRDGQWIDPFPMGSRCCWRDPKITEFRCEMWRKTGNGGCGARCELVMVLRRGAVARG
jgi:hypothetical protein